MSSIQSPTELVFDGYPVTGPITGRFGQTEGYAGYAHRGIDFGVPQGTPVYAPAAGRVVTFTNNGSFGTAICIDHEGTPWFSLYAHLSESWVHDGQMVVLNQVIGLTGNTGRSTGPHLHWQVCRSKDFPTDIAQSADPESFMRPSPKEDAMTPEQVRTIVREVFDEFFPAYYRALTAAYWQVGPVAGRYYDAQGLPVPPDVDVVSAIAESAELP